jgi:hypothetical protein
MSSTSARSNTWTTLNEQGNNKLTYWPQVSPSPLTVSLPNKSPNIGSLEIVIVNSTPLEIEVKGVEFEIPIGLDGDVLTSTTNGIQTAVSDSTHWKIKPPSGIITGGKAKYELLPNNETGTPVKIPKGGSVAVQIFGFTTNTTPGAPTIEIKELTASGMATTSFAVTIFPWGFAFSDLVANVRDGDVLKPVAQVDREQPVILSWLSSVVDTDKYTVYYSTSQGQKTCPVITPGEWTSPPLTADTLFTLVVSLKNSVGDHLTASMSIAVAVTNPDLVAKSVAARNATVKGLTIGPAGNQQPSWTIDSSSDSLRFNNSSHPAATASLGQTGELSATALIAGNANLSGNLGFNAAGQPHWQIRSESAKGQLSFSNDSAGTQQVKAAFDKAGDLSISGRLFIGDTAAQFNGWNINSKQNELNFSYGDNVQVGYSSSTLWVQQLGFLGTPNWKINASRNELNVWYGESNFCTVFPSQNPSQMGWVFPIPVQTQAGMWCAGGLFIWDDDLQTVRKLSYSYPGGYKYATLVPSTISDLRFKREVQPVPSALDKIRCLSGVTFRWNEDAMQHFTRDIETTLSAGPNATEPENRKVWQTERDKRRTQLAMKHIGVLAQDVEAVLPEAVTTDADGYKSVRYDNLIPLLIEAIKEQDRLAARQQAEIERLKLAVGIGESPEANPSE